VGDAAETGIEKERKRDECAEKGGHGKREERKKKIQSSTPSSFLCGRHLAQCASGEEDLLDSVTLAESRPRSAPQHDPRPSIMWE